MSIFDKLGDIAEKASRPAGQVLTGYLQAKIRNTEANDQLKANILETAGANYLNEVLPEVTTMEKNRKNSYDRIATEFGGNAAELADINNIITGDGKGYDNFKELMKINNLDREKLDAVTFESDYNKRFNTRGMNFQEKYQVIFDQIGIKQAGGLGPYTVESQLKEETPTAMTKDQMTDTVQPVKPDFGSTQLEDYMIGKPDDFTQESQYRLRNNDIIKQAVTASGLDAKFTTNPVDGSINVTDIDEASQNKYALLTERANNAFAANPTRVDYQNIGTEAATYVRSLENFAKAGSQAVSNYFNNAEVFKNAPKTKGGAIDINSEEKVYALKDGTKVSAFEIFERQNAQLIIAYVKGSTVEKRFIREKFGRTYSGFFNIIDSDLEKQENS
tara:strand:+ start:939 stop:2105 length:1167 start_codon:yes stop_codon:yes gene_type:complete